MGEQWHVVDGGPERMNAITESEDATSGALAYVGREGRDKDADARLIATAPELLGHLKMAKALLMESDLKPANVCADIQEVIAKAEGREHGS